MKVVIALLALVALSMASPLDPDQHAVVVKSDSDNIGVGPYNYAYETSNGISASQSGSVINAGLENEAVAAQGSYKYAGPDGVEYSVSYVADENGFQPVGAHLPVNP